MTTTARIPSQKQVRIISDALDELPEKGPDWTISKLYTIGKLQDSPRKSLFVKIDNAGKLLVRITMVNGVETPWVKIPEEKRHMFPRG